MTQHEIYKRRYEYLKAQHRCVQCGVQDERTLGGKVHCAACNGKGAVYMMRRHDRLKEAGLCVQCGARPPKEGRKLCEECMRAAVEYQHKHREAMRDAARMVFQE